MASPTEGKNRIETLGVLRGFTLLGTLLFIIVVFGLQSSVFPYPGFELAGSSGAGAFVWTWAEVYAEGSLRGLCSILFGAGIILFLAGSRIQGAGLWYRRAGLLYWVPDVRTSVLLVLAAVMVFAMSLSCGGIPWELQQGAKPQVLIEEAAGYGALSLIKRRFDTRYADLRVTYGPSDKDVAEEYVTHHSSYASTSSWNLKKTNVIHLFTKPVIYLSVAFAMMLIGMALGYISIDGLFSPDLLSASLTRKSHSNSA